MSAKPSLPKPETIIYGGFKGMGDLLCAAPTIVSALSGARQVVLILFPQLLELLDLIDFGPDRHKLRACALPVGSRGPKMREFLRDISQYSPDLIWISPHAPATTTSAWKFPLIMWLLKRYYWPRAVIAGADSEQLSWLFNIRVPVDRRAPYMLREWEAYSALRLSAPAARPGPIGLVESISRIRAEAPCYDLVIHPGAGAANRQWPSSFYGTLLARIPGRCKIAVIGLPADVASIQAVAPAGREIHYLTGSLLDAVKGIAGARVALTMDSGSMFFANSLRVPTIALFGPSDPATVLSPGSSVTPVFEVKWQCQPCGKPFCSQKSVYCMTSIEPETVSEAVIRLLAA